MDHQLATYRRGDKFDRPSLVEWLQGRGNFAVGYVLHWKQDVGSVMSF